VSLNLKRARAALMRHLAALRRAGRKVEHVLELVGNIDELIEAKPKGK
jgi:hypothetical protein